MQKKELRQEDNRKKIQDIMSRQSSKKKFIDRIMTGFAIICVISALIPLGSILIEVVKNGISAISIEFLTQPPGSFFLGHGGIAPAIQGTLIVVGLASLIGAPVGILAGIYLSEYAGNGIFPSAVRFFNDVLTGLPSIVMGIVGYVSIVLLLGSFSVWAGAFALSIIMIPIVVRVTEESFKIVPNSLREARPVSRNSKVENYIVYNYEKRQKWYTHRYCVGYLQNRRRNSSAYNDDTWNKFILYRIFWAN